MEKITKAQKYAMIEDILNTVDGDNIDMLIEFVQAEQVALARKATKAKEKQAEKKTEVDELGNAIMQVLNGEPKLREDVLALVADFEEVTLAKVGSLLTKLFDLGLIQKTEVKATTASGKKTTRMAYFVEALAPADAE